MSDVLTWKAKRIQECSREELLEAVEYLAPFHEEYYSETAMSARVRQRLDEARATLPSQPGIAFPGWMSSIISLAILFALAAAVVRLDSLG